MTEKTHQYSIINEQTLTIELLMIELMIESQHVLSVIILKNTGNFLLYH